MLSKKKSQQESERARRKDFVDKDGRSGTCMNQPCLFCLPKVKSRRVEERKEGW